MPQQVQEQQGFSFQTREGEPLTIEEAVGQALGAASVCWENMEGTGVFDDQLAKAIYDALLAEIRRNPRTAQVEASE